MRTFMIDFDTPIFQSEYVLENRVLSSLNIDEIKKQALLSMDNLDGWCSKEKASIFIDLIYLLKPKKIVEIGVFGGKSLIPMAFALKWIRRGIIYGIDPYSAEYSCKGLEGENYEYWGKINYEKILKNLNKKITSLELENHIHLIKLPSDLVTAIPNIDILHIDGNHSENSTCYDVTKWVPCVRKGGVIIFEDTDWPSTQKAIEWLNSNAIKFFEISSSNNCGIWIKP